jgi:hypothetical protein
MPIVSIELRKVYRQTDDKFIAILDRIRNNTATQSDLDSLNSRVEKPLAPANNCQLSAPAPLACKARMFNVSCLMFNVHYFPAYEIINDELRDYRFYADDMLHPSSQAVEYIWQRFSEVYLSAEAKAFIKEWQPLKAALNHKPFNPESDEYRQFMNKTMLKIAELQKKYPNFAL